MIELKKMSLAPSLQDLLFLRWSERKNVRILNEVRAMTLALRATLLRYRS